MNPKIIAISGNMGAGKATLARALQDNLKSALLSWDDFDDISTSPSDYVEWYHRGQNHDEWDYPELASTLKLLKDNQPASHPLFKQIVNPTEYIVFDSPLGRLHQQTGKYIDIWLHIDVPLDVSLCRHLIRDYKNGKKTKADLLEELEYYLSQSRPLFFDDALKENASLFPNLIFFCSLAIFKILNGFRLLFKIKT